MSKLLLVVSLAACASRSQEVAPATPAAQVTLDQQAITALSEMRARDPGLDSLLPASAGYAVFPEIGAAGALVVGGAFGRGVLYQHGAPVGYVKLEQGSIGPQLGGQTFSELLVLRTDYDVARLKAGTFDIGANVTAVVLTSGAAASATAADDTTVFVMPRGGLMAGLTISGQRIQFEL